MKSKVIAVVGGFVALMIVNGGIYGGLLGDYFQEIMARHPDVIHEGIQWIFSAHFVQAIFMVALMSRMGTRCAKGGFMAGAWINIGIFAVANLMVLGMLTIFTASEAFCDVAINGFTGGCAGAVMGYLLGRFSDA
jgi:hypothetical protein